MSWAHRRRCIEQLKEIGYQVGCGFMVGSPGQTWEHLAEDLLYIRNLEPHMVGIGPFIPQHDAPFAHHPAGSVELTLYPAGSDPLASAGCSAASYHCFGYSLR